MSSLPPNVRLHELLADRALEGLDAQQQAELREMLDVAGVADDESYDVVAAAAAVGMFSAGEQLPASLRSKLEVQARVITATYGETLQPESDVIGSIQPSSRTSAWGWLAAAACLSLAAGLWFTKPVVQSQSFGFAQASPAANPLGYNSLEAFSRGKSDVKRATWGDFNSLADGAAPEIAGVQGEVVWSEAEQKGYMRLTGLKPNDPRREQYQLWIVDERGLNQRVSGAIFDAASGDVIVPIEPRIKIKNAAIFAVTIEAPGGTWVSDMSRRVCLAALPKG
jgi:hypothetical protein